MVDLDWLSESYALSGDDALDLIFERVDDALLGSNFDQVDAVLDAVELDKLDSVKVIGFLSVTRAAKSKLARRGAFVERARARLLDLGCADRIDRLMSGLD